jgi:hypothetical protein
MSGKPGESFRLVVGWLPATAVYPFWDDATGPACAPFPHVMVLREAGDELSDNRLFRF